MTVEITANTVHCSLLVPGAARPLRKLPVRSEDLWFAILAAEQSPREPPGLVCDTARGSDIISLSFSPRADILLNFRQQPNIEPKIGNTVLVQLLHS